MIAAAELLWPRDEPVHARSVTQRDVIVVLPGLLLPRNRASDRSRGRVSFADLDIGGFGGSVGRLDFSKLPQTRELSIEKNHEWLNPDPNLGCFNITFIRNAFEFQQLVGYTKWFSPNEVAV